MPRPDPRAEPDSLRPSDKGAAPAVERVAVSNIDAKDRSSKVGAAKIDPPVTGDVASTEERPSTPKMVTSADPRVAALEPLVERNDWKLVAEQLGPAAEAGKLPPNLGLVAAIAHNELAKDASDEARSLAIRSMAALLGLPPESEVARVIARRLLRKNPVSFRQRPAPPAKTSLLIVAIVLVVGGALGWFLSSPMFSRLVQR